MWHVDGFEKPIFHGNDDYDDDENSIYKLLEWVACQTERGARFAIYKSPAVNNSPKLRT